MTEVQLASPTTVPDLIASHIVRTSKKPPRHRDLAAAISEVTLQTQITGASILTITLIDPQWDLATSGFLDLNKDGLLEKIEVNFPEGSGSWWRLAAMDINAELSAPNLTLIFEDRIVSYLRDKWGPKTVAPGTTTRAQFVKQLVDEVGRGDGLKPIRFVCPSLNVKQPIEPSAPTGSGTTVTTPKDAGKAARKTNKSRGVGHGAAVTAKGVALDANQIDEVNTLLDTADGLRAGQLATTALICAAIGESWIGRQPGTFTPNSAGYWGVLQGASGTHGTPAYWPDPHDTAGMARSFLLGGKGFQAGGAIELARKQTSPGAIATMVEASGEPASFYGQYADEATKIIAGYGGLSAGSQSKGTGSAPAPTRAPKPVSDVSQLTRGTPDNPDESSWDCITRLASEVKWFVFSNGNTLYYLDGDDFTAQRPSLYLSRFPDIELSWLAIDGFTGEKSLGAVLSPTPSGHFDNTTFVYRSTHKRDGKIMRRSRIATPQTPSEVMVNLVCPIDYLHAGDVVVIQQAGGLNGRWVIADATRNVLADTHTQLTLAPPEAPNPEPQATDTGTGVTSIPTGTPAGSDPSITDPGKLAGVAQAAKKALAEKAKYVYTEGAGRGNNGNLFGPAPRTMDCSAFATLCYKAAGLPDPNHMGYSPIGYTGSFITHCTKIANPQPGDVCFYGPSAAATKHMTVYIGNGRCISMGQEGDPVELDAKYRSDFLGYYVSDVAPGAVDRVLANDPTNVPDH